MFPGGWPGAGLFLLRLAAAIPLIISGGLEVRDAPQLGPHAVYFAVIAVGIFLLAGLWMPVAGALQAIFEVWIFFSRGDGDNLHLLLAALGVSLVMLGPGAWSVDARLFGRKRIDFRGR
jgi:putative oxidoreductase